MIDCSFVVLRTDSTLFRWPSPSSTSLRSATWRRRATRSFCRRRPATSPAWSRKYVAGISDPVESAAVVLICNLIYHPLQCYQIDKFFISQISSYNLMVSMFLIYQRKTVQFLQKYAGVIHIVLWYNYHFNFKCTLWQMCYKYLPCHL